MKYIEIIMKASQLCETENNKKFVHQIWLNSLIDSKPSSTPHTLLEMRDVCIDTALNKIDLLPKF